MENDNQDKYTKEAIEAYSQEITRKTEMYQKTIKWFDGLDKSIKDELTFLIRSKFWSRDLQIEYQAEIQKQKLNILELQELNTGLRGLIDYLKKSAEESRASALEVIQKWSKTVEELTEYNKALEERMKIDEANFQKLQDINNRTLDALLLVEKRAKELRDQGTIESLVKAIGDGKSDS